MPIPPDTQEASKQLEQAIALHQAGNLDEAEVVYQKVLLAEPHQDMALNMLGTLRIQKGQLEAGITLLQKSLAINAAQPVALANMGYALNLLNRHAESLEACDKALTFAADDIQAIINRGNALSGLKRLAEAAECYKRIIALDPSSVESHYNLGCAWKELKRYPDAIACFNTAIQMRPDLAEAHNNLGVCYQETNACHEAIASYDRAITLQPEYIDTLWNKSLMKLILGEFEEGWRLYEWGWKGDEPFRGAVKRYAQPLWLGDQAIAGKTLLLHAEQGLGDTIQFCRYALMAKSLGARVIIQAPSSLAPLLGTLDSDVMIVESGQPLPAFDLHCPMMSLPLAFTTGLETIPADTPYLYTLPQYEQKWHATLSGCARPKIGLVWSGSNKDQNDHNRSVSLDTINSLLDPAAEFHCLQKEIRAEDQARLASLPHVHVHHIENFADTAALVSGMDLIISVDTSVAHLAGAMGKPVWILLPFAPDFRWLLQREDSPWYPTARLFRQPDMDDWKTVIERLKLELRKLLQD